VSKIQALFESVYSEQAPLPGGRLVIYSNRGDERFSILKEYRFEASSSTGFFSDLGTMESSYTPGKLPARLKQYYREEVASARDFRESQCSDAKLVYYWFADARGCGPHRPRAAWGKAWEVYFDNGVTIGRLDD
jgi:hypothetical protein